jgi:ribosomal protein L37AE/L43A
MSYPTYDPFELAAMSAPEDNWGYRAGAEREGSSHDIYRAPELNDRGACPAHPETLVFNEADQIWVCQECDLAINEAVRLQAEEGLAEIEAREPECSSRQTDVDLFDSRGCELHDQSSDCNVRRRAVTIVQRYDSYTEAA